MKFPSDGMGGWHQYFPLLLADDWSNEYELGCCRNRYLMTYLNCYYCYYLPSTALDCYFYIDRGLFDNMIIGLRFSSAFPPIRTSFINNSSQNSHRPFREFVKSLENTMILLPTLKKICQPPAFKSVVASVAGD
jgi:hypothetical protein